MPRSALLSIPKHQRIGQAIVNVLRLYKHVDLPEANILFYMEDQELLELLLLFAKEEDKNLGIN